ncbi:hypothetical protein HNP33_003096 [Comamonas odontotermitis]|uniref:Uncharacterized protein n=1 Tax=Comamonas odontotermitis TaxID=379895 RepID=A0ABR6RIK4_9BURK|nr:hypothetical protein [Comamonas odontotermitis]MBB6578991.1 hypothetical protein [Comamonas odontotermitis]
MQNVIITIERAPNGQDVVKISADYQGAKLFDSTNPAHQIAAYLMQVASNLPGLDMASIKIAESSPNQTIVMKAA